MTECAKTQTKSKVYDQPQTTIYNTKFDEFVAQDYLDEDDCLDLFDEMADGQKSLSLAYLQSALQEEGKDYDYQVLYKVIAMVNPAHFDSLLRKDFPIIWFICTCFDARDSEQVLFIICDVDQEMGLTKDQYQNAMQLAGFDLDSSDVDQVFQALANTQTQRLAYKQFHYVLEELFRAFLAM